MQAQDISGGDSATQPTPTIQSVVRLTTKPAPSTANAGGFFFGAHNLIEHYTEDELFALEPPTATEVHQPELRARQQSTDLGDRKLARGFHAFLKDHSGLRDTGSMGHDGNPRHHTSDHELEFFRRHPKEPFVEVEGDGRSPFKMYRPKPLTQKALMLHLVSRGDSTVFVANEQKSDVLLMIAEMRQGPAGFDLDHVAERLSSSVLGGRTYIEASACGTGRNVYFKLDVTMSKRAEVWDVVGQFEHRVTTFLSAANRFTCHFFGLPTHWEDNTLVKRGSLFRVPYLCDGRQSLDALISLKPLKFTALREFVAGTPNPSPTASIEPQTHDVDPPTPRRRGLNMLLYVAADARGVLPEELQRYADYANYMQHRIIVGRSLWFLDSASSEAFTLLKYDYLAKIIPVRVLSLLRGAMVDCGLIECDGIYSKGRKSFGYRLANEFAQRTPLRIVCQSKAISDKIKGHRRQEYKSYTKIYRYLFRWLTRVEIDMASVFQLLERITIPDGEVMTAAEIKQLSLFASRIIADKEFTLSVCNYGRVHTNLTRLLSELRCTLRIQGETLVNIDIANSQPLFLGLVIKKALAKEGSPVSGRQLCPCPPASCPTPYMTCAEGKTGSELLGNAATYDPPQLSELVAFPTVRDPSEDDIPPADHDLDHYLWLCENGTLYDELMERIEWRGSRAEFKAKEWFKFLYGQNRWQSKLRDVFESDFPTIWNFIANYKRERGYEELSRQMQRDESRLMINTICERLMNEHPSVPVLPIHDSIMTTPQHVGTVKQVMLEEFAKIGVKPTLK